MSPKELKRKSLYSNNFRRFKWVNITVTENMGHISRFSTFMSSIFLEKSLAPWRKIGQKRKKETGHAGA